MDQVTPAPRRKRTPAQRFRDFLSRQGFRPWVEDGDAPGTIWFHCEGLKFVARLDERDEDFVQICLGFLLREESRDELTLLRTMNEVQAGTKVVKVFVPPERDFVEFQIELYLDGRPMSPKLLERCLVTLRGTSSDYLGRVRPEPPKALA